MNFSRIIKALLRARPPRVNRIPRLAEHRVLIVAEYFTHRLCARGAVRTPRYCRGSITIGRQDLGEAFCKVPGQSCRRMQCLLTEVRCDD